MDVRLNMIIYFINNKIIVNANKIVIIIKIVSIIELINFNIN